MFKKEDGADSPHLLFESNVTPSTRQDSVTSFIAESSRGRQVISPLLDKLSLYSRSNPPLPCLSVTKAEVTLTCQGAPTTSEAWMVLNALGSSKECIDIASRELKKNNSKMIPWVGLAVKVMGETEGNAFCFLPLPIKTGLPWHVNAFFELASNRREIWQGGDLSGSGKNRADWNIALLTESVPSLLSRMLLEMSQISGEKIWDLFPPPPETLQPPWSQLSLAFYSKHLDTINIFRCQNSNLLQRASRLLFLDTSSRSCELQSLCTSLDLPIVAPDCPLWIEDLICRLTPGTNRLSPELLVQRLRNVVTSNGAEKLLSILSSQPSHVLLSYILSGVRMDPQGLIASTSLISELDGLPILPLLDGKFGAIRTKGGVLHSHSSSFIIPQSAAEQLLLMPAPHLSLDTTSLPHTLLLSLTSQSNLITLSTHALNELVLPHLKPNSVDSVVFAQYERFVDRDWLKVLWRWLLDKPALEISQITWPIVPIRGGQLVKLSNTILIPAPGWSDGLFDAFDHLGVSILDHDACDISSSEAQNQTSLIFQPPNLTGALRALLALSSSEKWRGDLDSLTPSLRNELRGFIVQPQWFGGRAPSLEPAEMKLLHSLPLFRTDNLIFKSISEGLLLPPKISLDPSSLSMIDPALLGDVITASPEEMKVLQALGVCQMTLGQLSQRVSRVDAPRESLFALGLGIVRKVVSGGRSSSNRKDPALDEMIEAAR